jgi:hypothetical protein
MGLGEIVVSRQVSINRARDSRSYRPIHLVSASQEYDDHEFVVAGFGKRSEPSQMYR